MTSCPYPKPPPPVICTSVTVHPVGPCADAEELADRLDAEQRAHEVTRQALVQASREVERLLAVERAARSFLAAPLTSPALWSTARAILKDALQGGGRPLLNQAHEEALREEQERAVAPFLQWTQDLLAPRPPRALTASVCRRLLRAFGRDGGGASHG